MLKFKRFYLINLFIIFFSTFAIADNKIAYIDFDLILAKSKPSKLLFSQLKIIEEKRFNQLDQDEKNLIEKESKIVNTKNLISREEYTKNVNNFKKNVNDYKKTKKEVIQAFKNTRNKEVKRFLKLINPIIETVMEEKSIGILIEKKNIFIAKSNYDITPIVLKRINTNIKDFLIENNE